MAGDLAIQFQLDQRPGDLARALPAGGNTPPLILDAGHIERIFAALRRAIANTP